MIDIDREPIETDVLIVGGGIAGLMAAINAAGRGVSVTVAKKANTERSGSGYHVSYKHPHTRTDSAAISPR